MYLFTQSILCLRFDVHVHDIALLIRQNIELPENHSELRPPSFVKRKQLFFLSILFKSNSVTTLKRCGFHKRLTPNTLLYTFTST